MLKLFSNIKRFREEKGWSQTELAQKMGYSEKSSISRLEAGKLDPTVSQILTLCEVFGVDIDTLWGDKEPVTMVGLTSNELAVLTAYRNAPRVVQDAVNGALGVEKREQLSISSRKEA